MLALRIIFILSLLSMSSPALANTCAGFFHNKNLTQLWKKQVQIDENTPEGDNILHNDDVVLINQRHPMANLPTDGSCGPTCTLNLVQGIRSQIDLPPLEQPYHALQYIYLSLIHI